MVFSPVQTLNKAACESQVAPTGLAYIWNEESMRCILVQAENIDSTGVPWQTVTPVSSSTPVTSISDALTSSLAWAKANPIYAIGVVGLLGYLLTKKK